MTRYEQLKAEYDNKLHKLQNATWEFEDAKKELNRYTDFIADNEELLVKANAELTRIMAWFENNKDAFGYMDLKLHDASYYAYDQAAEDFPKLAEADMNFSEEFYYFCDISYDQMVEDFRANGWDWDKRKQLGHTSSFFLHDELIISMDRRRAIDEYRWDSTLYGLIDCLGYNDICPDFTTDGKIDLDDGYLPDCGANLNYIASGEFYTDIIKKYDEVIKMYEYIKEFKANQVEYFKEHLAYQQDELEWEAEQDKKAEEKANDEYFINVASVIYA